MGEEEYCEGTSTAMKEAKQEWKEGKHNFGTTIKIVLHQVLAVCCWWENNLFYTTTTSSSRDGDYGNVGCPVILEPYGIEAERIADACDQANY